MCTVQFQTSRGTCLHLRTMKSHKNGEQFGDIFESDENVMLLTEVGLQFVDFRVETLAKRVLDEMCLTLLTSYQTSSVSALYAKA